jgi:hypothetical protein
MSVTGPALPLIVNGPVTVTGNYRLLPFSQVTSSSLCYFDVDDQTPGQQFRLIFTQDVSNPPYKLTASNPGQFYYNVFYVGTPGTAVSLTISIPYPFVTQGSVPIQVYGNVSIVNGCFVPSSPLTGFTITGPSKTSSGAAGISLDNYSGGLGSYVTITVSGVVPQSGLVYVTIHLDFGLKGKGGYSGVNSNAKNDNALLVLPNNSQFVFEWSDTENMYSATVMNKNVFKRDPGFAGIVADSDGNPQKDVKVEIYSPTGALLATVYTDIDGWYLYDYKYTGKPATFTITLSAYDQSKAVTMKSNGFVVVNFQI